MRKAVAPLLLIFLAAVSLSAQPAPAEQASLLVDSAIAYARAGVYDTSLQYCDRAIEVLTKAKEAAGPPFINAYLRKADILKRLGDLDQAIIFYGEAKRAFDASPKKDSAQLGHIFNGLGNAYTEAVRLEKALVYYAQAQVIFMKMLGPEHARVAYVSSNMADCYAAMGQTVEAVANYQKAIVILKKADKDNKHGSAALAMTNLGNTYFKSGNYKAALSQHREALKTISPAEKKNVTLETEVTARIGVSRAQMALGDTLSGLKSYALILSNLKLTTLTEADFERVRFPAIAIEGLNALGRDYLTLYQKTNKRHYLLQSEKIYALAVGLIDYTKSGYREDMAKEVVLKENYPVYEGAIHTSYLLYEQSKDLRWLEKAFSISEKSRNAFLNEALTKTKAASFAGIPESLLQRERTLKTDISSLEIAVFKLENDENTAQNPHLDSLQVALAGLKKEYYRLSDDLEQRYPRYFQLTRAPQAAILAHIQQSLRAKGATLVEYFTGDSSIFAFVITPGQIAIRQVKLDFPLREKVAQLRESLSNFDPAKADPEHTQAYIASAHQLYTKLVQPIESLLEGRIIFVPGGVLSYVPFEALLTTLPAPADENRWDKHAYFGRQSQVSYHFSAAFLSENPQAASTAGTRNLLAIAPEFKNSSAQKFGTRSFNFEPLKYNITEALAIRKIIGGKLLKGAAASVDNFLTQAKQYKILHLATHGQSNDKFGEYSFIAFSPEAQSADKYDLLFAKDLFNMQINADLVVLSACETGSGEWLEGEGIVGLGRGFFYAGARSLVTTLWQISDQQSARLMQLFYQNISHDMPKDRAMYEAKLAYLSSSRSWEAHPYFWAGFITIGDMSPVPLSPKYQWWWPAIGLALLLGFFIFLFRKRLFLKRT
jgi:CHAT domain-containing protein